MIKNPIYRPEGPLFRSAESVREVVAAWFVLLLIVAAGLSILAAHRYSGPDCTSIVAAPGMHHPFAADYEWDDPACSVGSCGHSQAAREIDSASIPAAQSGGVAMPLYSGSSKTPVFLHGNGGDRSERLC